MVVRFAGDESRPASATLSSGKPSNLKIQVNESRRTTTAPAGSVCDKHGDLTPAKNKNNEDPVRHILANVPPSKSVLDLTEHVGELNEAQLAQLTLHARHVTSLVVRHWAPVRTMDLRCLAVPLGPTLTSVDLGHSSIEDVQLEILAAQLTSVRTLLLNDCHSISSKGIKQLVQGCHASLTWLSLAHCKLVSSDSLLWMAGTLAHGAAKLRRLKYLDVSSCEQVRDEGLDGLARGCKNLLFLNASDCPRLTHHGFQAFHALRVLRLQGCRGIGDKALVQIGATCPDLRSLNVGRCGTVSDKGLSAIGRGCPGLQSLNIAGAARVSEEGLCELAHGCVGLQVLNINGCTRITKNGLQALMEGLKYVRGAITFEGFIPKDEALEEKLQDVQYYLEETAAIRLQNGLMKRWNRRWGREHLLRLRLTAAASSIQRAFRRYVKNEKYRKMEINRVHGLAVGQVQRIFRGYQVRKKALRELRARRELLRLGNHATVVQTAYRGWVVRKHGSFRICKAITDLYVEREQEVLSAAAVYIQAICRSRLARTRAAALYTIRAQRLLDMSVSALPIQCAFRRYWAMKTLARLKADKLFKHVQTLHATRVIQRAWFGYKGTIAEQRAARALAAALEAQRLAVTNMQATFRGFAMRKTLRHTQRTAEIEARAATIIQSAFRSSQVMRWPEMRMNKITSQIWDMNDMEYEISAQRTADLLPRLYAVLRVDEASSDSVDDEEDVDGLWEEVWDEARQCYHFYNPVANIASDTKPLSKHATQLALVDKQVRIYWPAEDQWFGGYVMRYNKSKRKHKIGYDDGDEEWMDLRKEADRVQVFDNESWLMVGLFEPPEVAEDRRKKKTKREVEKKLAMMKAAEDEWLELAEDHDAEQAAQLEEQLALEEGEEGGDASVASTASTHRIRLINKRTGEVAFKSVRAAEWELGVDEGDVACYINRRTGERSYDNPKIETTPPLTKKQLAERKETIMDELHVAAYFLANVLEENAAAVTEKQKRMVYKKLDEPPMAVRMAGALASLRDLIGLRNCERDEYYVYCKDLLVHVDALKKEKEEAQAHYQAVRHKLLDVVKADSHVECVGCGHRVARTNTYCPVCGTKITTNASSTLRTTKKEGAGLDSTMTFDSSITEGFTEG